MAASSSPPETKTFPNRVSEAAGRAKSFFEASIYRVPEQLRTLKPSAYSPRLFSIGPFHNDLESHQARDLKMWYVNSFVGQMAVESQDSNSIAACNLDELKEEMAKDLDRAKKHYAEDVGDKLTAEMLVVDGCFILKILYRDEEMKSPPHLLGSSSHLVGSSPQPQPTNDPINGSSAHLVGSSPQPQPTIYTIKGCSPHLLGSSSHLGGSSSHMVSSSFQKISIEQPTDDPIFDSPLIYNTVQIDLLLLENQIPFFVLEKLFSLTLGRIKKLPTSVLIPYYIIPYFENMVDPEHYKSVDTGKKVNDHILQILHDHNLPQPRKGKVEKFVSSALELEYSGVKFSPSSPQDLSEINFNEGKCLFGWFCPAEFTIPQLSIYDYTEQLLRNLIAFEQCHPSTSPYFTSYAFLMDMLVSSEKDVEVLEKAGVIQEYLGSKKDVCDLLNNIAKEIVLEDFFFAKTCRSARDYSNRGWSKFMAQLRRKWFASPWTFIAFCVAGLVFGISITQFIFSFLE